MTKPILNLATACPPEKSAATFFRSSEDLVEIATQFFRGVGNMDDNLKLAHKYLFLAAKKGNISAANILDSYFKAGTDELCEEMEKGYEALRKFSQDVEAGDPDACFLFGVGKLSDAADDYIYHKGLKWIKLSAEKNYPPAMYAYGYELFRGKRIAKDEKRAIEYFKAAAEQGDTKSMRFLYRIGETILADKYAYIYASEGKPEAISTLAYIRLNEECYNEAINLFERAAALGDKEAMFNIAVIYDDGEICNKDPYKAAMWYMRAAESGYVQAMVKLGILLENGPEEIRNEKIAFDWYVRAAENGLACAWNDVASCYKRGVGVSQSFEKAKEYYMKAIESDQPERAYYNLYILYTDGIASSPNTEEALSWLSKAAEKGHPNAMYEVGVMYLNEVFSESDYRKGFEYLQKASEYLPEAMDKLGHCYSDGVGSKCDDAKAFECYTIAAAAGNAEAQYDLGMCYRCGIGVMQDYSKAVEWYKRAIAQGHTEAMVHYAFMLDNGIGGEKDLQKAFEMYMTAAEADNREAQFLVGDMYFQGRCVDQDYLEAMQWFSLAAQQGHPNSIYHMAICYSEGLGVERDIEYAVELLYAAADSGCLPAIDVIIQNGIPRPSRPRD